MDPNPPLDAELTKATDLLQAHQYRQAADAYASANARGDIPPDAFRQWGTALAKLSNHDEAIAKYEVALLRDPLSPETYSAIGEALAQAIDRNPLIARLNAQVQRANSAEPHLHWATTLQSLQRPDEAMEQYRLAAEKAPQDGQILLRWAALLTTIGRHQEAFDKYRDALAQQPGLDTVYDGLRDAILKVKDKAAAFASVQRVVDESGDQNARLQWAMLLTQMGRHGTAEGEYEKAAQGQSLSAAALTAWSQSLRLLGRRTDAAMTAVRAVQKDPLYEDAYDALSLSVSRPPSPDHEFVAIERELDRLGVGIAHELWGERLAYWRPQDAVTQFDKAKALGPLTFRGSLNYADALFTLKRWADAEREFENACGTDVEAVLVLDQLPDVVRALEPALADAALHRIGALADAANSPAVTTQWASVLETLGRFDAALAQYERAAKAAPDPIPALTGIARAETHLGHHDRALQLFMSAIERDTAHEPSYEGIHEILSTLTARDEAIARLQARFDGLADGVGLWHWGSVLAHLGRHDAAIEQFEAARGLNGNSADVERRWANSLVDLLRFEEAIEHYQKAIELGDDKSWRSIRKALRRVQQPDACVEALSAIVARLSTPNALSNFGYLLSHLSRFSEAAVQHEAASKLAPHQPQHYIDMAYALNRSEQYARALAQCEKALAIDEQPHVHGLMGDVLTAKREFDRALGHYERAAVHKSPSALFDWALAFEGMKRLNDAQDKYRECIRECAVAIAASPFEDRSHVLRVYAAHNIANLMREQGDYTAAHAEWRHVRALYDAAIPIARRLEDASFFYYHATVLQGVFDEHDAAERSFREALSCDPHRPDVLGGLCELYQEMKTALPADDEAGRTRAHQDARTAYATACSVLKSRLEHCPTAANHLESARLALTMEEFAPAEGALRKCLELDPASAHAQGNLGVVCMRTRRFKQAIRHFEIALNDDPGNLSLRANLAEACLKGDQIDRAETEYARVLDLAPGNIDAMLGLAKVCMASGNAVRKAHPSGDADTYFVRVREHLDSALKAADNPERRSRALKIAEIADARYTRAIAGINLYETQSFTLLNKGLLNDAIDDFQAVTKPDVNFHKAQRAIVKVREYKKNFRQFAETTGRWLLLSSALGVFVVTQMVFYNGVPALESRVMLTDESLQALPAQNIPQPVLQRVQSLVNVDFPDRRALLGEVQKAIGPELSEQLAPVLVRSAFSVPTRAGRERPDTGYYILLTFGSLIFMFASFYLAQISKFKFAGLELEKNVGDQVRMVGSLGISSK